jgi:hypothetical protein
MTTTEIVLSAKGLGNIPQSKAERDFTFVVGQVCYRCPFYVADFLSSAVCRLHEEDATVDKMNVNTEDPNHYFESFLGLGFGESVELREENRLFFESISRELENHELLLLILKSGGEEFVVSNAIDVLRATKAAHFGVEAGLKFIASHFSEFESSELEKLSYDDLGMVLCDDSLKLTSEDSLCELLLCSCERDLSYFGLFEYVKFEYLSVEAVDRFCSFVSEHLDSLNVSIWSQIRSRLLIPIPVPVSPRPSRFRTMKFCPVSRSPLDGIIAYLSRQCHGNVHTQGVVTITGRDCMSDNSSYAASNAADLTGPSYFYSKNEPNQSLTYDFGARRVKLSHYSIRSRHNGNENDHYLQSWVIEGSIDDVDWVEVDRHEQDLRLNFSNPVELFAVKCRSEEFRLVRLRQTGPNRHSSPSNYLVVSGFELFGSLTE